MVVPNDYGSVLKFMVLALIIRTWCQERGEHPAGCHDKLRPQDLKRPPTD